MLNVLPSSPSLWGGVGERLLFSNEQELACYVVEIDVVSTSRHGKIVINMLGNAIRIVLYVQHSAPANSPVVVGTELEAT
jgi:hypothetical protein